MGRLGNQMFQYAAGRRLAVRHGVELVLYTSWFDYARTKGLSVGPELDPFELDVRLARVWDVARLQNPRPAIRALQHLRPSRRPFVTMIGEGSRFAFEPRVLEAGDRTYLAGYWQAEAYFKDVAPLIRNDFRFPALSDGSREVAAEIDSDPAQSVSVHVRRSDYVSSAQARALIGSLDLAYYRRAIDVVAASAGELAVYVFSDDPAWCRANMSFEHPTTIVDRPLAAGRAWEDMRLMCLCRHHVVANSSFSWWAAWLDPSPDKLVVAPRRWLAAGDDPDDRRVPETWLRV